MDRSVPANKIVGFLVNKSNSVIILTVLLSCILTYPLISMSPSEQASPNPPGEVYDMQVDIDNKFPTPLHFATYIVESRNGDVLTSEVLRELAKNEKRVIQSDLSGDLASGTLKKQQYLFSYFDPDYGFQVTGIRSIIGPIEYALFAEGITLHDATDEDIKMAVARIMGNPDTRGFLDMLSIEATSELKDIDGRQFEWWSSPATILNLMADNGKLGGAGLEIGLGGGPDVVNKERLNRKVAQIMKGESLTYDLWGVAMDANLESEEEGRAAGVFIMFTVIGAVLVVGLSLRSYWATAITGIGLGILMIWLKGISTLVGIKSGLVIDLVVPIAMISLGVDFMVHAVRRYGEEVKEGYRPRRALKLGLASVSGALVLAMLSDSIAFMSQLSSNIEAVIHFGCAAAIAVVSSFVVLGIVAPIVNMRIDELITRSGRSYQTPISIAGRMLGGILASCFAGFSVIMMLALSQLYGVLLLGGSVILFLILPIIFLLLVLSKQKDGKYDLSSETPATKFNFGLVTAIEKLVLIAASNVHFVLIGSAVVTAVCLLFALRLEPTFDVKDFFDSDSDFVIGLDKIDQHLGESGGEPGIVYIRGDLMNPSAVLAVAAFVENLKSIDNVAKTASGETTIGLDIVNVSRTIMNSSYAVEAITSSSGVTIADTNLDGIPDTKEQMEVVFGHALKFGVQGDGGNLILRPDQVRGAIYFAKGMMADDHEDLTTVTFMIPGTRDQAVVAQASMALRPLLEELESTPAIDRVGLTGSPFTREKQLSESTKTLYKSLPIAVSAATILLFVAMKSLRYAVVTVVPIGLVVVWLYGVMYIAGFALNFVTAMIGAISIGVGIDYSIHMTERFREELLRNPTRLEAIRRAAGGTGVALVASAVSSIVGFTIMGFAPMPMFATYGQITAVMILLALVASLIVLPCLLMLVTSENEVLKGAEIDDGNQINSGSRK